MTDKITVRDIVYHWLKERNYDGLFNYHFGCGCELDDLMPCCSDNIPDCEPGYKKKADPDSEDDWVIEPVKVEI